MIKLPKRLAYFRKKSKKLRELIDQRRLDGVNNQLIDSMLKKTAGFISKKIIEPTRIRNVKKNQNYYTREGIIQERNRVGKKS